MTLEMQAGQASESQKPSLPEEAKTVMPAAAALFAAVVIEGVVLSQVAKNCPPPKLVLMTMMGELALSSLCVTHQSQAAAMSAVVAVPPGPEVIFSA